MLLQRFVEGAGGPFLSECFLHELRLRLGRKAVERRIAVDEACAMLLSEAVPGTDLTAEFELTGHEMQVRVEVATVGSSAPKRDDFAWMVLTALADDVDAVTDSTDRMAILLRKRRGAARPA